MQQPEAGPSGSASKHAQPQNSDASGTNGVSPAPMYALPPVQFYSVEYPGYVKSTSVPLAVERLGGPTKLEDAFKRTNSGNTSLLELHLRPGNSFAHPVPGEVVSTNNILLKVIKRRRKKTTTGQSDGNAHIGEYVIQPIGVVPKTARFRNMADYQFQPNVNEPVLQLREAMNRMDVDGVMSYRVPEEHEDYTITEKAPMNIDIDPQLVGEELPRDFTIIKSNLRLPPPPVFSRVGVPQNYNYKANPASIETTVIDEATGEEKKRLINRMRWKGFGPIAVTFSDKEVPDKPSETIQAMRPQADKTLLKRLEELFEERPIWTRAALFNQLTPVDVRECVNSKYLLPLVSYVFQDGPWRDTQVKLGYDPRQDPEARFYQRVYFRNINHPIARPSVVGRRQEARNEASIRNDLNDDERRSHIFDGLHVSSQTAAFQLCDLTDQMLKDMVEDDEDIREKCHERDGWYTTHAFENIKTVLRHKYFSLKDGGIVASQEDCEHLLKREGEQAPARSFHKLRPTKHNMAKGALRPEDAAAKRLRAKVDQQAKMANRH